MINYPLILVEHPELSSVSTALKEAIFTIQENDDVESFIIHIARPIYRRHINKQPNFDIAQEIFNYLGFDMIDRPEWRDLSMDYIIIEFEKLIR